MKKMSRADLAALRERKVLIFEERLRKENLKAKSEEAEVIGERGERAEIAAEAEAEEQRRLDAAAYDFRLAAERQQLLMDMKARRLEAEEVRRPQRPPPHLTSPRITPPHLSLKLCFRHTLCLFLSLSYTRTLSRSRSHALSDRPSHPNTQANRLGDMAVWERNIETRR